MRKWLAIVNNNNGARFETYVIEGERGSGKICLNGAASRLVEVDDVVIIMTYVQLNETELINHVPKVAVMNEFNQITQMKDIMNSDNLSFFSKVFFF